MMKSNKYLVIIDHYVLTEKWIQYEKVISSTKKEIEDKYEKVWQRAQDFCIYEATDKEQYKNMKQKVNKIIKDTYNDKSVDAKNINFYLIPLTEKHLLKHIDFNKKNKNYENVNHHHDNIGVWECLK